MRNATVSQMKTGKNGPRTDVPQAGTRLREVYDLFQNNRGKPVEFNRNIHDPAVLVKLEDYYGLDIRKVQRRNQRRGQPSLYILAGEWCGRVYVDYVAERIEAERPQ